MQNNDYDYVQGRIEGGGGPRPPLLLKLEKYDFFAQNRDFSYPKKFPASLRSARLF